MRAVTRVLGIMESSYKICHEHKSHKISFFVTIFFVYLSYTMILCTTQHLIMIVETAWEYRKSNTWVWHIIRGWQQDVCLTVSRNYKVFLLSSTNIWIRTTIVTLWNDKSYDLTKSCLRVRAWRRQPSHQQLDKVVEGRRPKHLLNTPMIVIRTLHDCPSQMNENLLISNSKLTSDSELIWWR